MKPIQFLTAIVLSLGFALSAMAACSDPKGENVDWSGCNLKGANLKNAFLNGANLEGANLEGANLRGAYLRGANLKGANLKGVELYYTAMTDADLSGANLEGVDLNGTNFANANLSGVNLTGTKNLPAGKAFNSHMSSAILAGAIWGDGRVCAAGSIGKCK